MIRTLSFVAAVLVSGTLLGTTASQAAPAAPRFVATPVAQPTDARLITQTTPWQLRGASYVADTAPVRDMMACQLVARETGRLSAFVADGEAFDAAKLDQCNTKAKHTDVTIAAAK